MLRYLTAGESHGKRLVGILEGMPSGLTIDPARINEELARRQSGWGRSQRMEIERDEVDILSGIRKGITIGSPIALAIENRDYRIDELPSVTKPRAGHADLPGAVKYDRTDIRDILERASARETAIRVAVGAVCKILLKEFGIDLLSHVIRIGGVDAHTVGLSFEEIRTRCSASQLNCADETAEKLMVAEIEKAKETKDTLGGVFEIIIVNLPIGLGSHVHFDRKLDGRLAGALMSIQAVKGVEIGLGFKFSERRGSEVGDKILFNKDRGFFRSTNNTGGIEGGMTNGEPVVVRGCMKPLSTLGSPLRSVDIISKQPCEATVERSDICAVPAAGVVGEAVCAFEVAQAMVEKFGGDSLKEMKRNYRGYIEQVRNF